MSACVNMGHSRLPSRSRASRTDIAVEIQCSESTRVSSISSVVNVPNMAESIDEDKSSVLSMVTSNPTEPSHPFWSSIANSTSGDVLYEGTTEDTDNAYRGLDWSKYPGYAKAPHTKRQCTSWTWKYGYKVQHIQTETLYWLCKLCVAKKSHNATLYASTGGSHSQIRHLKDKHNLDSNGPIQKKRRLNFETPTSRNAMTEQALINQRISNFNPERFKTALVRWMAYGNIAYRQVELPQFHDLLQLAYADIEAAGCLSTADTIIRWTKSVALFVLTR